MVRLQLFVISMQQEKHLFFLVEYSARIASQPSWRRHDEEDKEETKWRNRVDWMSRMLIKMDKAKSYYKTYLCGASVS